MISIENKLLKLKPSYLTKYDGLIRAHAQFGGGSKGEKFARGKTFSNVYEFYIYSFFVGLHKGVKVSLTNDDDLKTFWDVDNWKPRELVLYLIACAIGESDFDMSAVENMSDDEMNGQANLVKSTIESYANGGLMYIQKKIDEDPDLIDDDMLFIRMISD